MVLCMTYVKYQGCSQDFGVGMGLEGVPPPSGGVVWGAAQNFFRLSSRKKNILQHFCTLYFESVFTNGNGLFSDH